MSIVQADELVLGSPITARLSESGVRATLDDGLNYVWVRMRNVIDQSLFDSRFEVIGDRLILKSDTYPPVVANLTAEAGQSDLEWCAMMERLENGAQVSVSHKVSFDDLVSVSALDAGTLDPADLDGRARDVVLGRVVKIWLFPI